MRLGARDVGEPGYENATGFGVLNMPGALSLASRRPTTRSSRTTTSATSTGARSATRRRRSSPAAPRRSPATADVAEDPVDVYRVKVRARRRVRLSLVPIVGDPDLFVFGSQGAQRAQDALAAQLVRRGATERISVRNKRPPDAHVLRRRRLQRTASSVELFNASYALRAR